MGRPTAITDLVREAIEYLWRPGVSVRVLHAELRQAGVDVSHATVHRYLRKRAEAGAPIAGVPARATTAPPAAPTDELAGLEAELASIDAALVQWRPLLGVDRQASLTYQRLVAVKESITRTLVELRPRPEAEAERLAALGHAAKQELLERVRAQARVDEDLRGRVQRQAGVIANMADLLADRGADA